MKHFTDFKAFSKVGRDLAHRHLNYETVQCYAGVEIEGDAGTPARKRRLRTAGKSARITLPRGEDEVRQNPRPRNQRMGMERQSVSKDKDSGIINDANLWATETMNNPA